MNRTKTETSTVLKAQAGDPEARAQVISEMDQMVGWVLNVVSWNGDREDGMQEGRIGVLEAIERFDASKGVQFNTFAFYLIRKNLEKAMKRTDTPQEEIYIEDDRPTMMDRLIAADVREAVLSLPEDERDLILARFYGQGMVLEEIGNEQGIHKWTVSIKITKILEKLRSKLA
jgi:RNA polymerase sigma factor (sigma-70 family)